MKKLKKIISICIILIAAFLYAHIEKMNMIYDKNVDNSAYLNMGAVGGKKIEQKFNSVENTLDGVYIKCQIVGDISNIDVKYTLTDATSGDIIRQNECKASSIKNAKFNKFFFDTIDECKGKEFVLTIWSESGKEENGISFYYQPKTEKGTKLVIDNNETQGTMIMKTITKRFDIETFCVLLIFVGFIICFMMILYRLFE